MRYMIFGMMLVLSAVCAGQERRTDGASGTTNNDAYDFIAANRVLMWIANSGATSHNPLTDAAGLEWPAGSGKFPVYQEGLVFGGWVGNELRVGGSTYRQGLQAGHIAENGASDPHSPDARIFKAHRFDAGWWNALTQNERQRFTTDLLEWPVVNGAPWHDANGNGVYDPDVAAWTSGAVSDAPLLPGEEVLWFVSNDMDGARTSNLYGTRRWGWKCRPWSGRPRDTRFSRTRSFASTH